MNIERIHQEIKFRWNKLNSNHEEDFPAAYLDDAINKVVDDYIEIFYSGNNSKKYKFGFEVNQQRIDMLESVVKSEVTYSAQLLSQNRYAVDLSVFNPSYRHFLRGFVIPTNCLSKRIPITIVRLNDLDTKLEDANTKPSLSWNRCLGTIKENKIFLYTDYPITEITLDYIINPVKVFSGGYDSLEFINGDTASYQSGSPKVQLPISESYHNLIVDMVVQYLSYVLENNNKVNLINEQIISKI